MITYKMKRPNLQVGASNTELHYGKSNSTYFFTTVKKRIKSILRSFSNDEMSVATPHHFQGISDPDGVKINVALNDKTVSVTDKEGNIVKFSAYLVPEVRATLLEIEKKFGRRFAR